MVKSIFSILGPVMIGPSSSHTAGAEKLGHAANVLCGGDVKSVKFTLHGSFALTGKGHGTDKALLAGVMAISAKDERIKQSFEIANERGVAYCFETDDFGNAHPNTVKIEVTKSDNTVVSMVGCSIGGGNILITQINGIACQVSGDYPTAIISHWDRVGVLSKITNMFEKANINIVAIHNSREARGELATTIVETDSLIPEDFVCNIKQLQYIERVEIINKIG